MTDRDSLFTFDYRPSDSPLVDTVWHTQSHSDHNLMMAIAESRWGFVVTQYKGKTSLGVIGPETKAGLVPIPKDAEIFGIIFKLGSYMPHLPTHKLLDTGLELPPASCQSVWLHSSTWQLPTYENADTFVNRLVRENVLVFDPLIQEALRGEIEDVSLRSVQRRFLQTTGLTHSTIRQIERAHYAAELLRQGSSILDTVYDAGYFDQPHMTKSLKRLLGQTPAEILRLSQPFELALTSEPAHR
jgi:Helix-turn-helix domain